MINNVNLNHRVGFGSVIAEGVKKIGEKPSTISAWGDAAIGRARNNKFIFIANGVETLFNKLKIKTVDNESTLKVIGLKNLKIENINNADIKLYGSSVVLLH